MTTPTAGAQQVANPYYGYGILYLSPNFHRWEASRGPRYRDYRLGWASRAARHDPGEFPLNLNIEVTTHCNLACTFCTQPTLTKDQLGTMPWELYTQVIDEGEHYHVPAANLNGLGEPLLLRRLPDMIAYAKQRGILDVMFHTNGTIMSESLARALIESGLDRIIFSVDSPDKATYEAMRLRSTWDAVVANVRFFAEMRTRMGRTTPLIRTTMVVTDTTAHQVPDFVQLWKPLADQITLQDLTWRTKILDNGEWQNREQSAIPVDMDQVRDEAKRRKLSFVCPYLYQSAYAFWNGDVIPCSNPNARKHMIMGNLGRQSLSEMWHGNTYHALRTLHESGRWDEHPICRECEVPLIELYKALERERATPHEPQVAEAFAQRTGEGVDLVGRMTRDSCVVAIHQPEWLPWLGFLDKLRQCDVFVLLDHVQFEKHYYQNRNRVRTATPRGWTWLTVPVRTTGRCGQPIGEVEIDHARDWRRTHLRTLELNYRRAPAFAAGWPSLRALYERPWERLADASIAMIHWLAEQCGITTRIIRSSTLGLTGSRSALLLSICQRLGATEYLSGISGRDYLEVGLFEQAGIGVRFQEFHHPIYRQCYEPFIPALSSVDLVFNYGAQASDVLVGDQTPRLREVFT